MLFDSILSMVELLSSQTFGLLYQPVLWSFEARHWLLFSSYESPRWHLLPIGGCFSYIDNLLFCVATFINILGLIFWITCCSFYINTCCFTLHFYVMEVASFFNLMNQPLLGSSFSSAVSSPLSTLIELKRVRVFLWIRLWLKGMLWLVWPSIQTTKTFSISAIKLFHFFTIHVFTGVALLISCKNVSFAFTMGLNVWGKRPSFQPVSAFDLPSSSSLIISSFCFKVRDMQLFLLLEHLEATV